MKGSRYAAVGLVAVAALWIVSGHLGPHGKGGESVAATRATEAPAAPLFRVSVITADVAPHVRQLFLSGRTEAEHKVMITARTNGLLEKLNVKRGQVLKEGEVVAVLSDEAREAQVEQATALVNQRRTELEARRKLIEQGTLPRLDGVNLESQYRTAAAALAAAEAERDRGIMRAPWAGIITDVPAVAGQPMSSGKEIAQLVSLDPMLAIVEVSERKLGGVKVGGEANIKLVDGESAKGRVRYVSKSASATTRTYRVEVAIDNADGAIPDGITCEVKLAMAPVQAVRVPRSALTFSSAGELGVRVVDIQDAVAFVPVRVLADGHTQMWVDGIVEGSRVIVQGQDFVREGQRVAAVPHQAASASAAD